MAFNIVNVGFDGTFDSPYAEVDDFQTLGDTNDIFSFIGTTYGRVPWSNPVTNGPLTITFDSGITNSFSVSQLADQTDSEGGSSGGLYPTTSGNNIIQVTIDFGPDLLVKPTRCDTRFRYYTSPNPSITTLQFIQLLGSLDNSTYATLETVSNFDSQAGASGGAGDWSTPMPNIPNNRYWRYLRFYVDAPSRGEAPFNIALRLLKFYGSIIHTGQNISKSTPINTFEGFPDTDINNPTQGDYLFWNRSIIENRRFTAYTVLRQTLSGTLNLNTSFYNFRTINPGGANRDIVLPSSPFAGYFLKIKNLDPAFELIIKEVTTTVATIGGGGVGVGLTHAEIYHDGTEFHILTY